MKRLAKIVPFLFVLFLFLFLRVYNLEDSLNFGSDQGMTLLEIYNLYKVKKIVLISQSGSSLTVFGRYFYFGPAFYYILLPILLIFSWNPLSISYFMIVLQLVSLIFIYRILKTIYPGRQTAFFFALLYAVTPIMVNYSRSVWSPNILIPLAGLILYFLLRLKPGKSKNTVLFILIGFFLGLGFQMHYSFFLTILVVFVWLAVKKQMTIKKILLLLSGLALGISPLIVFELRHNFYNLQTLWLYFTVKSGEKRVSIIQPHIHYFLNLLPFLFFIVSRQLSRLHPDQIGKHCGQAVISKKYKYPIFLALIFYLIWSMQVILPKPSHGFTMVSGWNYSGEKKAAEIILAEDRKDYNVVDILTGDTRALAVRYLVTIAGKPPMGVTEYPSAKSLFIYSKVPIEQILKGHLWEIDCIKPVEVIKKWHLQNDIYLYLAEKVEEKNDRR
jgi:hypothetical protein